MTRLLVDLMFFTGKQGGTETVARELYSRLHDAAGWDFVGIGSKEVAEMAAEWFPGEIIDSGLRSTSRAQWAWGELFAVGRAARRVGADLIHSPANFGPSKPPAPLVLTLHDMLAFKRPEFLPSKLGAFPTRFLISRAARAATHIVTDSDAAKADILDVTGRSSADVTVVRPGGRGAAAPTASIKRQSAELFSLGNRMPHKNFPRLLEALSLIPAHRRPTLTISGSHGNDPLRERVTALGLSEWVRLRGWLTHAEIDDLYRRSTAVIFPTLFEGFGLPVLEAMERGCPVLCSDIPVLREVGGNAVRYFDAEDPAAMARAIADALDHPDALAVMARAGVERARLFTWDELADRMLEIFARSARGSQANGGAA